MLNQAYSVLKNTFGFDSFRPMQEQVVSCLLSGRDALVIMPTGGGKSLCFQVPALVLEGTTIVVSPLIALMKDQVESLRANGVEAAFLNSSQSAEERMAVEHDLLEGNLKLLYVSPEKLVTEDFGRLLQHLNINLFAIDEAHCISEWGHDFRPEYTQLSLLKQRFPSVPIAAFTATADKLTRNDISRQLGQVDAQRFVASFDRPNLSLTVLPGRKRIEHILNFLRTRKEQSGIVYCLSRKSTETVAQKLRKAGIKAAHYHAGMSADARNKTQDDFINDRVPVICATIAFGMGIDKPNVRYVVHYNMPKNMEGYYQEIGRAGRDGLPSDTVLFYSFADVVQWRSFFEDSDHKEVQSAKLERIQQYSEALICRRKILLSYFGEHRAENCGNCDVCKNPPEYFDGTRHVQMALSAIKRLDEAVPMSTLIKVLIGSSQAEVIEQGFHHIKTYGAGKTISYQDWQQYMEQMIHFGYIEVAYDNHNHLHVTEAGSAVLFGKTQAQLVVLEKAREKIAERAKAKPKTQRQEMEEELFEQLRALRKSVAGKQRVPPYVVFSDVALKEMAAERPLTDEDMLAITGVGQHKLKKYGPAFMEVIQDYLASKARKGKAVKGGSQLVTLELLNEGRSIPEIATERQLNPGTVYGHIADLYQQGHNIDLTAYISQQHIDAVRKAVEELGGDMSMSAIREHMATELDYALIKLALAWLQRNQHTENEASSQPRLF